ncbi:MAG: beta-hexosaminidase [Tenericutes bacterium]|nr:beta-hexosaminidase [Mycoplasmatota bacterium]
MKKILIVIISVLVVGVGVFIGKDELFKKEVNKKTDDYKKDTVVSNDLFGKYYDEANKKMKNMSLEEKVGQLFLVRYDSNLASNWIKKYYPGGYIMFAKDFNNQTKESIKKEIDDLQSISKVPLVIAVDEEGGYVTRVSRYPSFRESKFLAPRSYYESGGEKLLEQTEKEKAKLLLSIGVNLNLAPVADVSIDSNDFINIRTFNRNAKETAVLIGKMVNYANEEGISSSLKHFPGYGNNVDTHTGIAIDERSYENFVENDYLPFEEGIKNKVPTVLVSHNIIKCMDSEYPATLSKKVISELREKLNFTGVVITDDLSMSAVNSYVENGSAAVLAVNAGEDLIITSDFVKMYNSVYEAVKNKKIDMETIDKAVRRNIAWKIAYDM